MVNEFQDSYKIMPNIEKLIDMLSEIGPEKLKTFVTVKMGVPVQPMKYSAFRSYKKNSRNF